MRRLGIISCQVFEWELAHILDKRRDIDNIYILNTPENKGFAQCLNNHKAKLIRDPYFLPRLSRTLDVLVNILPIGLHIDIDELEYECNENINTFKECASRVLLLYGLCGNALKNIIHREDVDLLYPRDSEGLVDDCICSILGRERYFEELKRNGSFFMIPGMVNHRDGMVGRIEERVSRAYSDEDTKLLLQVNEYERALIVEEGIETDDYLRRAHLLANNFGLAIERTAGDLSLLEDTIDNALSSMD
ncbi:MAG TPA: DUF1638 domain-containing protein [Candidatus Methanofastidiosa archaeon]|nr:DUF1638 domain-containing protein [Candidatus Methanofastidiosa archaeon]HPR41443.1 DUF1638 domain-containing protein [Candidatus Methanofastidiosa archaeon]